MQTVTTSHGDKLFVPDAKELGGKIASVDTTGWVSFGWIGSGDAYIIDKDEWSSFVAFVNEIDAAIRPNAPHEGADAALSRTLPLDAVVGPRGPERTKT